VDQIAELKNTNIGKVYPKFTKFSEISEI